MYQRSCDLGLGVPFNIASYALLTYMVAKVTDCEPKELILSMGDAHVYKDHIEPLKVQLERQPLPFPKLNFKRHITDIDDFTYDDFEVLGYNSSLTAAQHTRLAAQQTSIVNGEPGREVRVDWPLDLRGKREDEKCNRYKRARDHFLFTGGWLRGWRRMSPISPRSVAARSANGQKARHKACLPTVRCFFDPSLARRAGAKGEERTCAGAREKKEGSRQSSSPRPKKNSAQIRVAATTPSMLGSLGGSISLRGGCSLPDNDGAVTRGGEEEIGVLLRGGDGGDPALVAGEGALVDERLRPVDAKSRVGWGQFCCSRECISSAQIADDKGMLRMRNDLAQCRWWRRIPRLLPGLQVIDYSARIENGASRRLSLSQGLHVCRWICMLSNGDESAGGLADRSP
ncbi:hypothetical protein L1887_60217 [Cichorium endivia]|nr:hypothetical protein L1887_60217 [Cichorium endivia]